MIDTSGVRPIRSAVAALLVALLSAGVLTGLLGVGVARADSAPTNPADPATPATVTADPLPTVQINGVAWAQVVVGNTVYVTGKFTSARPAGAPAGTNETPRNNMLAYDIRTGALITSFAPDLNAQGLAIAASPDGTRVYVAGDFSSANGQTRYRVAAYNTATGALVGNFAPSLNGRVSALAATNTTLYIGGTFSAVGSTSRTRLAAVSTSNGALLPWAPVPAAGTVPTGRGTGSDQVMALVVTSGGAQVVAAGRFGFLNGEPATGIGALDAVSGATRPFAINTLITNQGTASSVYSLSTDGVNVYGTAYDFGGPGNIEGSFAAAVDGGAMLWANDCRGDTYSSWPSNGALYMATHAHSCSQIGGFPEENPRINKFATAVGLVATGTNGSGTLVNGNFRGTPAPSLLAWFPNMQPGTFTGQSQAGWTVSGNSQYVVYGGEFPRVNSTNQQGLVRFAVASAAPNKVGPTWDAALKPTVVSLSAGTARVTWQATWDMDSRDLTYEVTRSGTAAPVYSTVISSQFWSRPVAGFVDTGLTPGTTQTYRVTVRDAAGNQVRSDTTAVTVSAATTTGTVYTDLVSADQPAGWWRLGEAAGSTVAYDRAGFSDLTPAAGVTFGTAGALGASTDTAATFSGTDTGFASTRTPVPAPQTFSVEAWFQTTSTTGGKIIGFGNNATGTSNNYDRHVFMDNAGRLTFGVYSGGQVNIATPKAYNDGAWHHVVGTLVPGGTAFYVDGQLIGTRTGVGTVQEYTGYWRVGGDSTWSGGRWFNGKIDEVAVYPTALTAQQVARHAEVGRTGAAFNEPPVAVVLGSAEGLTASFDGSGSSDPDGTIASHRWDFGDGTTADGATVTHTYAAAGSYRITLTVTDAGGKTATSTRVVGLSTAGTSGGTYATAVQADGASSYWRLGESGGNALDSVGTNDLTVSGGVTRGVAGTIAGDPDRAAGFGGTNGLAATRTAVAGPNTFTLEAWFATTSTAGGKIVGFGSSNTGTSGSYDRHVYLDGAGKVVFGVYPNQIRTLETATAYNDGTWHHVVATLGSGGMTLYVDGQLIGSRTDTTSGQSYNGYWRVGGDNTWAGARFFTGSIDDVAVYPTVLTAAQVAQHHSLGVTGLPPNVLPTATYTATTSGLTASVDASASTDTDGTLAGWEWTFGDGGTGTGATTTHVYADSGTYPVVLTVTDDRGGKATSTQQVTVTAPPPNQPPTAAFTAAATELTASFDGRSSVDTDGAVTAWAWDFGDESPVGTGATTSHTYAAGGTYTVSLTVTDDRGATTTVSNPVSVTAPPPNTAPTAAFSSSAVDLTASFDASGSRDDDGTVVSYGWDFGDGTTGSGVRVSHAYATPGTYTVVLTVGDDDGAGTTVSEPVTVAAPPPPNVAPTAVIDGTPSQLTVAFTGAGSTDSDGTVVSWAWAFGDGKTGTGATVSHTYAAAGTYTAQLTVTDDDGATATAATTVTVVAPPVTVLVSDSFTRTTASGFGTADSGGVYTVTGPAGSSSVSGSAGVLTVASPAGSAGALLNGVSVQDVALQMSLAVDKVATGGGTYAYVTARSVGSTSYRAVVRVANTGVVTLGLARVVSGAETSLRTVTLNGVSLAPGQVLNVRLDVAGAGTTTLNAKAWNATASEPAAWQVTATDATAGLQRPGALGVVTYVSGSATNTPVRISVDDLWAGPAGTAPQPR